MTMNSTTTATHAPTWVTELTWSNRRGRCLSMFCRSACRMAIPNVYNSPELVNYRFLVQSGTSRRRQSRSACVLRLNIMCCHAAGITRACPRTLGSKPNLPPPPRACCKLPAPKHRPILQCHVRLDSAARPQATILLSVRSLFACGAFPLHG